MNTHESSRNSFGEWLRKRRRVLDLTQVELAGLVGCSTVTLRKLEHEVRRPSKQIATRLAEALQVAPDDRPAFLRFARGDPFAALDSAAATGDFTSGVPPTQLVAPRQNLPLQLTSFIGRGREIAEVKRLVGGNRLVTLTGPGGCGKTRLALQAAAELLAETEDAVWLVELAPLAEAVVVPQAVASALGLREQPGHSLPETLVDTLRPRHLLLVLDNCEHLVAACAQLAEALLRGCPHLRVLATSREPLGVPGEAAWNVPPLGLPEPQPWRSPASHPSLSTYEESEAIRLFVARASAAAPAFRLTEQNVISAVDVCRRLDGMPLAIELAAVRVRALSLEQIAERLDDRFRLLTGGSRTAAPRQQTLLATLDWSYALLSAAEQKTLQCLSVFAGGCTLPAAEAVCAGGGVAASAVLDLLAHLVDKSLVQVDKGDGETRYRLLETVRHDAQRRLAEAGDEATARDHHLNYFVAWAEAAEPHLGQPDKAVWFDQFETEHDNLRTALTWALMSEARVLQSLQLAAYTGLFWKMHGYNTEGRARLSAALAQPGAEKPENAHAWARAVRQAGALAFAQSDYPAVRALAQARLALYGEMGEAGRLGFAHALMALADVNGEEGQYAAARPLFEEGLAIYQDLGDERSASHALTMLGWLIMRAGDYAAAGMRFDDAVARCRALGDPEMVAQALAGRGELAVRQAQYPLATTLLEESLVLRRMIGESWGMAVSLGSLGWLALRQHDFPRMRERLAESLAIRQQSGDGGGSAWCLERLAEAAVLQGQAVPPMRRAAYFQRATRVFGAAAALRARLNAVMDGVDQPEFNRSLETLRNKLGEEAFAAAWAEGGAMTLVQATEYALAEPKTAVADERAKQAYGGLTARERQVAALIGQGQSNTQIAEAMVVGVRTVETYVTRIRDKLDLNSRVQIAVWAIEKGLSAPSRAPHP